MSTIAPVRPPDAPPAVALRSDWVLEGRPRHRTWAMGNAPGLSTGQWDCTAGRFLWEFGDYDEVVHVLEGSVHVTSPDGVGRTLGEGDCHVFPHGTTWEWDVPEYVRKAYVCRDARSAGRRARALPAAIARRVSRVLRPAARPLGG